MLIRITPPRRIWIPITTISSDWLHPLRSSVCEYTSASTMSAVPTATADWSTWMKKFARYWSSFIEPMRKNSQPSRNGLNCPPPSTA
jgi:hypothetical protein